MRKMPKQQRSREMVRKLVVATGQTIVSLGLENTTTNHVAAAANVDIASLYQYFSDKDDLIEALLESLVDDLMAMGTRYLEATDLQLTPLQELVNGGLVLGIAMLRANPVVMELARHWQRLSLHHPMVQLEQYLLQVGTIYFRQHFKSYPIEDLHLRLYVLSNSWMATISRHLGEQHPVIKDTELIGVLVEMFVLLIENGAARGVKKDLRDMVNLSF